MTITAIIIVLIASLVIRVFEKIYRTKKEIEPAVDNFIKLLNKRDAGNVYTILDYAHGNQITKEDFTLHMDKVFDMVGKISSHSLQNINVNLTSSGECNAIYVLNSSRKIIILYLSLRKIGEWRITGFRFED